MELNILTKPECAVTILVRMRYENWKFLDRCLFILSAQHYEFLEIVVIPMEWPIDQEFTELNNICMRWRKWFLKLTLLDVENTLENPPMFQDLLQYCSGCYVAIVDVHQRLYPNLYKDLISALKTSKEHVWVFCDVVMTHFSKSLQLKARWAPFLREGYAFTDHIKMDFIPLQSVLIDCKSLRAAPFLDFDFQPESDHDFLLMLASMYEPVYIPVIGAEQCSPFALRDGTLPIEEELSTRYLISKPRELSKVWWERELPTLQWVKEFLDPNWKEGVNSYELKNNPEAFYFRRKLEQLLDSRSWRMTRIMRILVNLVKKIPTTKDEIPNSERQAFKQIEALQNSTSWNLMGFIRVFEKDTTKND